MNKGVRALCEMAVREERLILGLMSGTSLDGLDMALCRIRGAGHDTSVEVIHFDTHSYDAEWQEKVRTVFARPQVDFPYLALLNEWIGTENGRMINRFLADRNLKSAEIDLIASHGQTVMHVPRHQHHYEDFPNGTLQIGDGDHLAVQTGIITISDFRQKHLAAGGEGAPLAVYGDYLIFSQKGEDRIMLNIGGIGNFTFLPGDGDACRVFVTDTGPGNTLMDAWARTQFGKPFDENAQIAKAGNIHQRLLAELKNHYFFRLPMPKTTGPEVFNLKMVEAAMVSSGTEGLNQCDVMATLNRYSAETMADAIRQTIGDAAYSLYCSGGGMHNPLLMQSVRELLPSCTFHESDILGIRGDAKEAVLFAVLANETVTGAPIDFGGRASLPGITMGKISFPW